MLTQKDLAGLRVCMLVSNNIEKDARVRKEAESLAKFGALVTVIGIGDTRPKDIDENSPYRLVLSRPSIDGKPILPRLGREDVIYPLRILINKTITSSRQKRYNQKEAKSDYIPQVIRQEMVETAAAFDFDIVHAHDLDTLYAARQIARKNKALLVYDSHELYLELHFLSPIFKKEYAQIEAEIFPQIDAFITVSPQIGKRLCEQYQRKDLDVTVLYNGGLSVVKEAQPSSNPVKLFFQGAFAPDRNLPELVVAMKDLQGKAHLTLQGWGLDKENIKEAIRENGLEDSVEIIAPCAPLEVVDSASGYDVGIINSIAADENFMLTLPNKLFDYMSAGLAVASTNLPPIAEIIDKESCGIVYEQKGPEHTAAVLSDLVSDPARIAEMKEASRKAAPKYAWEAQEQKLLALYKDLKERLEGP